ncbi:MAG: hypothetical protein KBD36_06800 [Alphaproteobacteria bacterium]|nr:hypothetical protein [Alphaproteobacteria bacterium]
MEIRKNYLDFYSPKEREEIIEDYEKSGLSGLAYCKKKGIPLSSFYEWKRKLRPSSCKYLKQTKRKWVKIMEDWQKSGMSPQSYYTEKKILPSAFYRWQSKLVPSPDIGRKKFQERWKQAVEDWEKSGLSKRAYCQEKGLSPWLFSKWHKRLRPSPLPQKTAREKWLEIMNDWKKSGLSGGKYCREKKLDSSTFYDWRKKLRPYKELCPHVDSEKGEIQPKVQESFMPLRAFLADPVEPSPLTQKIELMFPQGHRLTLEGSFDREKLNLWVASLLQGKV